MHHFLYQISDKVGLLGVACILIAYFLISTAYVKSNSLKYQLLNFTGAWLILYSLYFHWNLPSVVIEVAWILISIIGIVRALRSNA
ncbi:MAG: hypothetical protein SFW66_00105 [Gammaproteobacteria bacterium]|nr:hypothetical protein [Gammaproteobacteria bacterium]